MKRRNRFKFILLLVSFLPLLIFIICTKPVPKTIFSLNEPEIYLINQRRSYYNSTFIARLMENKVTLFIYKYQKNFFQGLDPNYYFFANHPRERAGVKETEKILWILMIPFTLGILWQLKRKFFLGFVYFIVVLTLVSFFESIDRYLYFIYPFFFLTIFLGFWGTVSFLRIKLKK